MGRDVHKKIGFASGMISRNICATASPGYKCPPVPPPAKRIVGEPIEGCELSMLELEFNCASLRAQWSMEVSDRRTACDDPALRAGAKREGGRESRSTD